MADSVNHNKHKSEQKLDEKKKSSKSQGEGIPAESQGPGSTESAQNVNADSRPSRKNVTRFAHVKTRFRSSAEPRSPRSAASQKGRVHRTPRRCRTSRPVTNTNSSRHTTADSIYRATWKADSSTPSDSKSERESCRSVAISGNKWRFALYTTIQQEKLRQAHVFVNRDANFAKFPSEQSS